MAYLYVTMERFNAGNASATRILSFCEILHGLEKEVIVISLRILRNDLFLRSYVFIYFISIILLFNVEPIMEGMYLLFLLFCMFIGFLYGMKKDISIN